MAIETVPKSEGTKKENRFAFRIKDGGKVYSVPKFQYLSGDGADFIELAISEQYDDVRLTRKLLTIECPAIADEVQRMAADQVAWISRKWTEASTTTPGESEGSENS